MRYLILLLALTLGFARLSAQVSGYGLSEYQYGNLPGERPKDLSTLYNQLNISYKQGNVRLAGRFETFHSMAFTDSNYVRPTQLSFQYKKDNFSFTLGNFYETLGKGLLLRTYEITGSIFETRAERVRYAFLRDLRGAHGVYSSKYFEIKALRGKMLDTYFAPINQEEARRNDFVEAIDVKGNYKGQSHWVNCNEA
ncbi:MAG: hypothetical protein HC896_08935 [Bacteroidales bacterium]|nr:hypothetical protein [Bacteroidales bacterium]